jgi:hypothetical protein
MVGAEALEAALQEKGEWVRVSALFSFSCFLCFLVSYSLALSNPLESRLIVL